VLDGDPSEPVVVVRRSATEIKAAVGPVAWVVLEELALERCIGGRDHVVATSVRRLAAAPRLDKDTVVRALHRLRDAGRLTPRLQPFCNPTGCN